MRVVIGHCAAFVRFNNNVERDRHHKNPNTTETLDIRPFFLTHSLHHRPFGADSARHLDLGENQGIFGRTQENPGEERRARENLDLLVA